MSIEQPSGQLGGGKGVRTIAFYLPQFHPTPENDEWWGAGFSEWTNVASARPLFRGHQQPLLPGALGFYDLRLAETREAQAQIAEEYGVEAFCYWHYWFGGKRVLERVFDEVLSSGRPRHGFALGWANQTWTGIWHGVPNRVLLEQTYPGEEDYRRHFEYLLRAFRDDRYFRVAGKPLLYIYEPREIPHLRRLTNLWRDLATDANLDGLYIVAETKSSAASRQTLEDWGVDACVPVNLPPAINGRDLRARLRRAKARAGGGARFSWGRGPSVWQYESIQSGLVSSAASERWVHPCVVPNWDNTARSARRGRVLVGATPELFANQVSSATQIIQRKPAEERLLFVKSWNEWAEGNYLEPDRIHGLAWLEALRRGSQL